MSVKQYVGRSDDYYHAKMEAQLQQYAQQLQMQRPSHAPQWVEERIKGPGNAGMVVPQPNLVLLLLENP